MSKKSARNRAETLVFKLGASRQLATALVLAHAGALAALIPIEAPLWLRAALATALLISLYRCVTRHALRSGSAAITGLRWRDGEGISVRLGRSPALQAARIRSRFVHRSLVLLWVQLEGSRRARPLAVAADSLDGEAFRRLRAALLASAQTPAG